MNFSDRRSAAKTPCSQRRPEAGILYTHFEDLLQYYWADLAWHEFYGPELGPDEVVRVGAREVPYREARRDFEILH